jgi:hypothetical protein
MSQHLGRLSAIGILFVFLAPAAWAQDEMVPNPFYKFWAGSKPGATAVHLERTKITGPEEKLSPDGIDEKRIAYKLLEVTDDRVTVEMIVTEQDFLGYVQSAPTKQIYPANIKKAHLERFLLAEGGNPGDDTVKVDGKDMQVKTLAGTIKEPSGENVEFKLWLSNEVVGMIVKQVRTTRQKGEMIAETTTTLESFKKAD